MQTEPIQTVFSKLTVFSQKPSHATCYLIQRNIKSLLNHVYQETRFNNSTPMKTKAIQQLKNIVLLSQKTITPYIEELLLKLANLYTQQADNTQNITLILQIAQLLGSRIDFQVLFLTIFQIFRPEMADQKNKNGTNKLSINLLYILSKIITHKQQEEFDAFRHKLMSVIAYFSIKYYENNEGLSALLSVVQTILPKIKQINNDTESTTLFNLLLNIQSTRSKNQQIKIRCKNTFNQLALKCGFSSVSQLYFHQISPILTRITDNKQYIKWNKTSKQRFQFDTLVRNSGQIIPKYIDKIFQIIQGNVKTQNDLQVRMDALVLIEYIINIQSIKNQLKHHSIALMKSILIPSIRWKIGSPQTKIRKAGILNMISLITSQLIDQKGITECFGQLLPPLKDCLTDDRQPDLRIVSLKLLEQLLLKSKDLVNQDILRDVYVSLLQRLDDSKNQLRIQTTKAINAFLLCKSLKLIPTIFQYLLNGVFVHFDCECDDLRQKILITLKHASKVNPQKVYEQAKINLKKMKHTSICQQLIEYAQQLIQQN